MADRVKSANGLTKADLIDLVYERHGGLTKAEAAEVIATIFDTVKTNLVDGKQVKIKNFGVFEVKSRAAREGVSPASGERIVIPSHKGLKFRPSPALKEVVEPLGMPGVNRRREPEA